jgi:hypothetical protein
LLRYSVLVGEYGACSEWGGGIDAVDGGDDGEEVLEFVEMVGCSGDGAVEGVEEGGVESAKRELGDDV